MRTRLLCNGLGIATGCALLTCACGLAAPANAADLPLPCAAGVCGAGGPAGWVTNGAASLVQVGSNMTITQSTNSATLNWQSFNISADGKVQFQQPDANSIALNRIFQADPSKIFGSLSA